MSEKSDRSKKSWRERDRQTDRSRSSSEGNGERKLGDTSRGQKTAYRNYKTQLEKLFEEGQSKALSKEMKEKLDQTEVAKGAKLRRAALNELLESTTPRKMRASLNAYREAHGFPQDEEALLHLLDSEDEAIVLEVIAGLEALLKEGKLKRKRSLAPRLEALSLMFETFSVQKSVKQLLTLLREN
jgi:hypothetical protein